MPIIRAYLNSKELSEILCVSRPTAISRMKHPERLTVKEIRLIAERGHIPKDKLKEGI